MADFSVLFQIGANLSGSFRSGFGAANNAINDLGERTSKLQKNLRGIEGAARVGFGAMVAGAAGAAAAINKSMNFNDDLQLMALTADMSAAQMQSFKQATLDAANSAGVMAEKVLAGGSSLIAAGMDAQTAEKMLTTMSRVVVANKADFEDISAATFSLSQQFGIAAGEMENAFNILSQGGKEGQFELKAMAQYLPSIGSRFKTMKVEGMEAASTFAAAMQVMRKNAPDDAQAATMLENMMSYAVSPKGLKYAAEMGSDIQAVIEDAWKAGENPIEAYVKEMQKISGGDAFKLGQLVRNDEARQGLQAMIQNFEEYERIKAKAGGSEKAGIIDFDYGKMGGTGKGTWDTFVATMGTLAIVVGTTLEPAMKKFASTMSGLIVKFQAWGAANPELLSKLVTTSAIVLGVVGALSAMALAAIALIGPILLVKGSVLAVIGGIGKFLGMAKYLATALPFLGQIIMFLAKGALLALGKAFLFVGRMVMMAGQIMLANPIIALIALIAAGVYLIYRNWETIGPFFVNLWNTVKTAFSAAWAAIISGLSTAWGNIKATFSGILSYFSGLTTQFFNFGKNLIQGLINGIGSMAGAIAEKARGIADSVKNTVKGAFGINSPSRVFAEYGKFNMQGLAQGMDKSSYLPATAANDAVMGTIPSMPASGALGGGGRGGAVLNVTQHITVGSGDAFAAAKQGAAAGAIDLAREFDNMMNRKSRLAL